jgi:hypothetical protein
MFCLTIVHTSASQTSLIPLKISSTLQKFESHKRRLQTDITLSESGYCRSIPGGSVITTASDCAIALSSLVDAYVSVNDLNSESDNSSPPGCYYVTGGSSCKTTCAVFNSRGYGQCWGGSYGGFTCVCHVNCPTGKYHGYSSCVTCRNGQYNDQTGRPSCKSDCKAGSYITSDKTKCSLCVKGKWQDLDDQTSCKPCADGKYNDLTGQKSNTCKDDCGAGSYITADKTKCSLCIKGQWQDLNGRSSCKPCEDGTYAPIAGSILCKDDCSAGSAITADKTKCSLCDKGQWQDLDDQSSCKPCGDGTYAPTAGSTLCKDDCSAGSYITADKTKCSVCIKGQWQDLDDQTSCKPCGDGKYNDLTGQKSDTCKDDCGAGSHITADKTKCSLCDKGQWQDLNGRSSCKPCEDGTYSNVTGQKSECNKCGQGKYASSTGSTSCSSCQSGFYNEQVGQASCKRCVSGKTVTKKQATSKDDCKATSSSSSNKCGQGKYASSSKSCSSCQSGFYNEQVGQSSCKRCASGKTTTKRQATSKDDCTTTSSSSSSRSSYNDNDYYDDDDDSYNNNNNNYSSSGGGTSVFVQILLYYLLPILGSCLLSCLFNQLLYKMGCKKRKEEQLAQGIEIPRTAVLPMVPPVPVQPDLATMLEGVRKEYGAGSIEYKMALDMAQEHILSSE